MLHASAQIAARSTPSICLSLSLSLFLFLCACETRCLPRRCNCMHANDMTHLLPDACGLEHARVAQLRLDKLRVKGSRLLAQVGLDAAHKVREGAQHLVHKITEGALKLRTQRWRLAVCSVAAVVGRNDLPTVDPGLRLRRKSTSCSIGVVHGTRDTNAS